METHQINSVLPEQVVITQSAVAVQADFSMSRSNSISQKIDRMAQTISDAPLQPPSKLMDLLKRLQADRSQYQDEIRQAQASMFADLSSVEQSLLAIDRNTMLHRAGSQVNREQIQELITDFDAHLKRAAIEKEEKLDEFTDKILNTKLELVQSQSQSKLKAEKAERQSRQKLVFLQRNSAFNQVRTDNLKQHIKKRFKDLKIGIEQVNIGLQKDRLRRQLLIKDFQSILYQKVDSQKVRQKESFQQNYQTLQGIFRVLSSGRADDE